MTGDSNNTHQTPPFSGKALGSLTFPPFVEVENFDFNPSHSILSSSMMYPDGNLSGLFFTASRPLQNASNRHTGEGDCVAITDDASVQCPPLAGVGGGFVNLAIMFIVGRVL
jgi:hypothetical protein